MRRLFNRRSVLGAGLGLGVLPLAGARGTWAGETRPGAITSGPSLAFSFERLKTEARTLAAAPFRKVDPADGEVLERIDYDSYQQIKFRPEASLRLVRGTKAPVQLFHLGQLFKEPVKISIVERGFAREVQYSGALFDTPDGHPARQLSPQTGFAGFRVMADDLKTDWLSFLGASYFRTSGPYNQYGLSARGLAVGTGLAAPEEFPRFTAFWLEGGTAGEAALTVYALLDSPSVTGAYRFVTGQMTDASGIYRVTRLW